ncbi:P-loop NTPase fold protein [Fructilactobacillus sp. Tb1]|uniref:P-loop NTPase fold protein n=1 Tax=Fructilactobacillus sp. Tb1 TaxID=3422304 RepID=UPI003D26D4B1
MDYNNEIVKKSLDRYLKSNDDLAFALNGSWGTGKTYFIKSYIKNYLSNNKIKLTYISLNELSANDDIYSQILYKINFGGIFGNESSIKDTAKDLLGVLDKDNNLGRFSVIPKIINYSIDASMESKIKSENKTKILILDDTERFLNKNKLNANEFIGLVTKLLSYRIKIIIIVDESKIKDNDFKIIKEKIINKSVYFGKYNADIACDIIKEKMNVILNNISDENIKGEFLIWLENFFEILRKDKFVNLRTINSILYTFEELIDELPEIKNDELLLTLLKNSFISIYIFTEFLKSGESVDEEKFKILYNVRYNQMNVNSDNNKFNVFLRTFFIKIKSANGLKEQLMLTSYIKELVYSDILYVDDYINAVSINLLNEIKIELINNNRSKQKSNILLLVNNLNYIRYNSEDELKNDEFKAKGFILNNSINILDKIDLYMSLLQQRERNILFLDDDQIKECDKFFNNYISNIEIENNEYDIIIKKFIACINKIKLDIRLKNKFKNQLDNIYKEYTIYVIDCIFKHKKIENYVIIPAKQFFEIINNDIDKIVFKIISDIEAGQDLVDFASKIEQEDFLYNGNYDEQKEYNEKILVDVLSNYNIDKIKDKVQKYNFKEFIDSMKNKN